MKTFEELNQLADQLENEGMVSSQKMISAKATPGEIVGKVCEIYHKVRPFLEVVANLFIIPKKWRNGIQTFMLILDGLCPGSNE